jgi:hypothetical protein
VRVHDRQARELGEERTGWQDKDMTISAQFRFDLVRE